MTSVGLQHYLTLSALVFAIGGFGVFVNRKNVLVMLMCLELMLLAVNLNFVAFAAWHGDIVGQLWALFILTVAAAETAIGLAIFTAFFRLTRSIAVEELRLVRDETKEGEERAEDEAQPEEATPPPLPRGGRRRGGRRARQALRPPS